jgi:hypothetical protein
MSLLTDVEGFGTENLGGVHQLAGIGKVNNSATFHRLAVLAANPPAI